MIYSLLMIVMLNSTDTRADHLGYYQSKEECTETAQVIGKAYYLKDRVDKVLYACVPYYES